MATIEDLQKAHEAAIRQLLNQRAGQGKESDWALVRALCHQAIHLCAERKAGEFCAVATLLADMIAHAHDIMHPGPPDAASHQGGFH